jgi:hypothetical protein
MEEDLKYSSIEKKIPKQKLIENRLTKAIDEAEEIINYESAHNTDILQVLNIVKNFIHKKKRICYGGTAINMLLPEKYKFYDPNYDLPDYDFLTPTANEDVKELIAAIMESGFKEVYHRVGIHKGTKKILVNFIAVADITEVDDNIYNIYLKETKVIDGIHYTNENMLRMMMYLELSRPRGEVSRWKKVYDRLTILNKALPIKVCTKSHIKKTSIEQFYDQILNFVIEYNRVIANLELESLYKKSLTKVVHFIPLKNRPIYFYSPDIKKDSFNLNYLLKESNIKFYYYNGNEDFVPNKIHIKYNNNIIAVIIEETACHSYNNITTLDNKTLHIASLETLITLYYSFYYFSKYDKPYLCEIKQCIKTLDALLISKKSQFKAFTINCSGYQKGFTTLLREKVFRIQEEKKTKRKTIKTKNTTLKKK